LVSGGVTNGNGVALTLTPQCYASTAQTAVEITEADHGIQLLICYLTSES
jgi:hypothetical protein